MRLPRRIWVPLKTEDIAILAMTKWNMKFNYYIFIEGINVILFMLFFLIWAIYDIVSFKPILIDPIENVKNIYLNSQFFTVIISLIGLLLISFFAKSKEKLIKQLLIIAICIFSIITFFSILKMNMDNTYSRDFFEEVYDGNYEYDEEETYFNKKLNIRNLNIIWETEKDTFIADNLKAYKYFSIKVFSFFVLQISVFILNLYMLIKVIKKIDKLKRLEQNDIILEDDVQDVKY